MVTFKRQWVRKMRWETDNHTASSRPSRILQFAPPVHWSLCIRVWGLQWACSQGEPINRPCVLIKRLKKKMAPWGANLSPANALRSHLEVKAGRDNKSTLQFHTSELLLLHSTAAKPKHRSPLMSTPTILPRRRITEKADCILRWHLKKNIQTNRR